MMMHADGTVVVRRLPSEAFQWIADPERASQWPGRAGSVVTAEVDLEPARSMPAMLQPLLRWRLRRQLRRELDALRACCQADGRG